MRSQEKIRAITGIQTSDLRTSSLALYNLRYPASHASSFSNLPLEVDATLARLLHEIRNDDLMEYLKIIIAFFFFIGSTAL